MRISDWSSDVCSSDLRGSGAATLIQCTGRRSRPLPRAAAVELRAKVGLMHRAVGQPHGIALDLPAHRRVQVVEGGPGHDQVHRSEEHTSELQSLMRISYAVFRLKKKSGAVIMIYNFDGSTEHLTI